MFQRAAGGGSAVQIVVWNGLWRANGNWSIASGSKGAGVEPPLRSGYVLAYHEWMQYSVKQGGTAGILSCPGIKPG